MSALVLTLVVSLVLAAGAVGLMVWTIYQGTHEHHDRLALIPLEEGLDPPESAAPGSPSIESTAPSSPIHERKLPEDL